MAETVSRVIRTIVFLLVVGLLIWAIFILFRSIFTSGNQTTPVRAVELSSYAGPGTVAEFYIDGPIVVDQEHKALRISVEASQSKIELMRGYEGHVVRQDVFPSTQEGYINFLKGLDSFGFASGNRIKLEDERGQCPLQYRYVYTLKEAGRNVVRHWSTSCGSGNFGGKRDSIQLLFQNQIPIATYNEVMRAFGTR